MIPSIFKLRQLPVTASTNDDAKRAAESGEAEGLVVQALHQTAGKGRQGRVWESPEGNLYASVLLRPRCTAQEAGCYAFVAALAVADVVKAVLPKSDVELKWPNDVLVGGKKISGVLLEANPPTDGKIDWLVIGVGLNVSHYPDEGLFPATSMAAEGVKTGVQEALETLLTRLSHWRGVLQRQGFEPLRTAWLALAKKGPLVARLPQETVEGAFAGLNGQGHLILRLPDGKETAIAAGDVFFKS